MSHFHNLLLTTDFSDCAKKAIAPALELAKQFKSTLTVLHVVPSPIPYPSFYYGGAVMPGGTPEGHRRLSETAYAELDAWLGPEAAGVSYHKVVLEGHPVQTILNYVAESKPDLLLMSTHGYGFFKRAMLGSTAQGVVSQASCPVLTVKCG